MTFVLTDLFGESDECRILEVFVENPECELSSTEIMHLADVGSRKAVYAHITRLMYNDVIMLAGRDGNIEMYKLNCDNTMAKILITLERTMASMRLGRLLDDKAV